MSRWPLVQLRRVASFAYGDSLADADRAEGDVPVYGSNGPVGRHDRANTRGPVIVIGRKGSFGRVQYSHQPVFAIDTTYFVDESCTRAHLRWLYYALQTLHLDQFSEDVGVPGLSRERTYSLRLAYPPEAVQSTIVDFLDAETSLIDAIIEKKQRLLELLAERTWVTRTVLVLGRDVGEQDIHPVLGSMRRDWVVKRVRHVVPRVGVGVVVNPSSYFATEGVPFIHGSDIRDGWIDHSNAKRISLADSQRLRPSLLEPGDVVVVRAGYPGRAAVVTDDLAGANCASVLVLKRSGALLPAYLAAYFNSDAARNQIQASQYGAAQEQVNVSHVLDFAVPVPSLREQEALLARLAAVEEKASRQTRLIARQIELLAERRDAVITAAVTGELDLGNAA